MITDQRADMVIALVGYAFRFAFAMVGYAAAVVVSVLVSVFLMLLPTVLPDDGAWGTFHGSVVQLGPLIGYGLFITTIFAFPGFVIALALSHLQAWHHWLRFSVAGALNALFALSLFGAFGGGSILSMPFGLALPCAPGGFVGGLIYWLVAGRFLARRWGTGAA